MSFDDDFLEEEAETGSDELLSADDLRLPEEASPLVRLHAIRAWLARRRQETRTEIGEAALVLQQLMQDEPQMTRLRRREQTDLMERVQQMQRRLESAQQRTHAYEEASELLEDCINHTTLGERALVEYYLSLEDLLESSRTPDEEEATTTPRQQALMDVQHRVEHVSANYEED